MSGSLLLATARRSARSSCGKTLTGALCSLCDSGFYKADDTCVACGEVNTQDALLLLFY